MKMASPTSTKHEEFIHEPMGDKPVADVPGIGPVIGRSLTEAGIKTAKQLYGHYLANPDGFKDFMKSHGANEKQRSDAYNAMKGWDEQNN